MAFADPEKQRLYNREQAKKWRAEHPDYYRKWYAAHREQENARTYRYREEKAEQWQAYTRAYYAANAEKIRAYGTAYAKTNPGVKAMHAACRRTAKLRATPQWAIEAAIRDVYDAAAAWNSIWPQDPVHVDHVVPLRGKKVCGLHVHNNLQILRARDNQVKHARFEG